MPSISLFKVDVKFKVIGGMPFEEEKSGRIDGSWL